MTHDSYTMRPAPLSCEQFEDRLGDYLERDLDATTHTKMEHHRAGCEACAALVAELTAIAQEAAALPALEPSHDLWAGISARIEAPVLPLASAAIGSRQATVRPAWTARRWIGAAAAALFVVSAGAIALRQLERPVGSAPSITVATAAPAPGLVPASPVPDAGTAEPDAMRVPAGGASSPDAAAVPSTVGAVPSAGGTTRLAANTPAVSAGESVLDGELTRMRRLLAERRQTLDTATVRVLESNIAIIDHAIAESRAALARDPASDLLNRQLSDALGDKLELMRTAVMLTSGD